MSFIDVPIVKGMALFLTLNKWQENCCYQCLILRQILQVDSSSTCSRANRFLKMSTLSQWKLCIPQSSVALTFLLQSHFMEACLIIEHQESKKQYTSFVPSVS